MLRAILPAIIAATALSGCQGLSSAGVTAVAAWPDVINIRNPMRLPAQIRAQRVPVELGAASVSEIEVVRGLNAGDQVIISDMRDANQAPAVAISR